MEGSGQRVERMGETAVGDYNPMGVFFLSSCKERSDEGEVCGFGEGRQGEERRREGRSALPSVGVVGGASLCRCRSHQSQGPCTGSTGRGGGT